MDYLSVDNGPAGDPVTSDGAPGIWRRWQIAVMCGCTEVVTFSQEYPDVVSRTESACHPSYGIEHGLQVEL